MINRSKMRRQLYRGGGIADLYPRQKYGIGSWVKERVRKLSPNELADVAVKAAPFVAPFNPLAAGLMRGIGRFDQRGSISDALKQGVATYGLGQGARYLGGAKMQTGFNPMAGMEGMKYGVSSPIGAWTGPEGSFRQKAKELAFGKPEITKSDIGSIMAEGVDPGLAKHIASTEVTKGTSGLFGFGGEFNLKKAFGKGVPAVFAGGTLASLAIQKAMGDVGEREPGESLTAFNKRRKGTVSQYLDMYFRRVNKFRIAPENMDAAAAKFVADNTKEYVSEGGRIGYQTGGITMANTLQENIRRNQAQAAANEGMLAAARSKLPGYVPPRGELTLKDIDQTGMPRQITQEDVDTYNFTRATTPIPKETLMAGFEDYIRDNPDAMSGVGTAAMMPVTLPGGYEHEFSGSTEANAFNKYLESIGQAPYTRRQSPINMKGPLGIVPSPFREDPGDFGPDGIVIDGKRYYSEKEAIADMGIERYNMFMSKGGRVGFAFGTPEEGIKSLDAGAMDITYEGNEGPGSPQKMAFDDTPRFELKNLNKLISEFEADNGRKPVSIDDLRRYFYIKYGPEGISKINQATQDTQMSGGQPLPEDPTKPINPFQPKPQGPVLPDRQMAGGENNRVRELLLKEETVGLTEDEKEELRQLIKTISAQIPKEGIQMAAKGGRIGYRMGMGPAGLPGIPRRAPDGMEFDMRENGGFQPLGAKEKKDDVPAMLAKNEFVFTADAVRGAGGGDIELGAQRMYDTMKNLEKRVI